MKLHALITVGNYIELGAHLVKVESDCRRFITLHIPIGNGAIKEVQLEVDELQEFLVRTASSFTVTRDFIPEK